MVRPERRAQRQRHRQHRLVPDRRRRRLLHRERSARLDDRLLGIAGRRDQPLRSATGQTRSIRPRRPERAPRRRRAAAARPIRKRPRRRRRPAAAAAAAAAARATSCRRRRRERRSASTGTRRSCCRRTIRARSISAPIGCSSSTTRGDTWMASPDLTRNIGRNDRPIMGVAGKAPMASKHDGAASYSNIVTIGESPVVPGHRLGRHQRRQRAGQPRRRRDLEERRRQRHGRAAGDARLARRAVALRRRHAPTSRSTAIAPTITSPTCSSPATSAQTWTSIAVEPAGRQRQRDQGRSEEPQPALPRHRVRVLHLAERRHASGSGS